MKTSEPLVARGATRHGTGDRSSNGHAAEERRVTITTRSVLPRTGADTKPACGVTRARAMRLLAKSHRANTNRSAARRDFPRRGCRMGGSAYYSGERRIEEPSFNGRLSSHFAALGERFLHNLFRNAATNFPASTLCLIFRAPKRVPAALRSGMLRFPNFIPHQR